MEGIVASMKKILIYDVAAENSGARTILDGYYKRYFDDGSCMTYLVTSALKYKENEHLINIVLPWVKRSKIHRIFCDLFYIKHIIRDYKIDEIVNLQNISLGRLRIPQTLYLHNAIPLSDIKFNVRKEHSLWMFKNVIGPIIVHNLKYSNRIIVQAEWIAEELSVKCGIDRDRIYVERVLPTIEGTSKRIETDKVFFFYPAMLLSYKNHMCIIEACKRLKERNVSNYQVVFTVNPDKEGKKVNRLIEKENLPIKCVGTLNEKAMINMYRKSVLVFPSYLETVGLPLVEAQLFDAEIFAVNLPYAREALRNYSNVRWFDYRDPESLEVIMKQVIEGKINNVEIR